MNVQRFPIGTQYLSAGKWPRLCTVVDVHRTYNNAGELVALRYVATHQVLTQTVIERDIVDATIARGVDKLKATA